jgi:hypothetical protein
MKRTKKETSTVVVKKSYSNLLYGRGTSAVAGRVPSAVAVHEVPLVFAVAVDPAFPMLCIPWNSCCRFSPCCG